MMEKRKKEGKIMKTIASTLLILLAAAIIGTVLYKFPVESLIVGGAILIILLGKKLMND
jgi:hypothetical protein